MLGGVWMCMVEVLLFGCFFFCVIWWINGVGVMFGCEGLWWLLFGVWMIGVVVGVGCVV